MTAQTEFAKNQVKPDFQREMYPTHQQRQFGIRAVIIGAAFFGYVLTLKSHPLGAQVTQGFITTAIGLTGVSLTEELARPHLYN